MKKWLILLFPVVAFAVTQNMRFNKPKLSGSDTEYLEKFDTIFDQIDAHDHTSGNGVRIRGAALAGVSTQHFASGAITSAKLTINSVTGAAIADGSVTIAKLAPMPVSTGLSSVGGFVTSIASGSFLTSSTAFVTSVSAQVFVNTYENYGPVMMGLKPANDSSACYLGSLSGGGCEFRITDELFDYFVLPIGELALVPCSSIKLPFFPSSAIFVGGYYKLQARSTGSSACFIENASLYGYQL